jgi:hypothetical protein
MALALAACGGASSGGGGGPTAPGPAIIFTPDRAAGANSISMHSGAGTSGSVLELEIVATDVLNVKAVDFVLAYPADRLRFDGFERGDFIGAGAQVIVTAGPTFQILRTAPSAASGTGTIIKLTFTAVGAGQGRFDFLDPVAEDLFGLEIPGIDWIGGTVRVVL